MVDYSNVNRKFVLGICHTPKIHGAGADAIQTAQHFRLLHLYTFANCFVQKCFDEAPAVDAVLQIQMRPDLRCRV